MTEESWVPLSRRGQPHAAEALHEGVPPWLVQSMWDWVRRRITVTDARGFKQGPSQASLQRLERRLRIQLVWQHGISGAFSRLEVMARSDEKLLLDLVDALLSDMHPVALRQSGQAASLERELLEGGSAWRVGVYGERLELQSRVDETVTAAARNAMEAAGGAGEHLAKAWAEAYGISPDPTAAYAEAVKAVEAAAQPVVTPEDSKATLGKMITALGAKPDKWSVVLPGGAGLVRQMADGLWKGQTDRHGGPDPTPVTQEGAEASVHLAVLLVQWFNAGAIGRAD